MSLKDPVASGCNSELFICKVKLGGAALAAPALPDPVPQTTWMPPDCPALEGSFCSAAVLRGLANILGRSSAGRRSVCPPNSDPCLGCAAAAGRAVRRAGRKPLSGNIDPIWLYFFFFLVGVCLPVLPIWGQARCLQCWQWLYTHSTRSVSSWAEL